MAKPNIEDAEKAGVYNIPSISTTEIAPEYNHQISKYVTYNSSYIYADVEYKIKADKSKKRGIYTPMMNKMLEQLNICESKFGRVFAVIFILQHEGIFRDNSKWVTRFRKNLFRKLERKYGMNQVGFAWCREREEAKGQHYHFWLFLDGRVVHRHQNIYKLGRATWKRINPSNHFGSVRNPFYDFTGEGEVKQLAVDRLSYLAKATGKGKRPSQNKDYSTSRLKAGEGRVMGSDYEKNQITNT